jgi:hypothetical protein
MIKPDQIPDEVWHTAMSTYHKTIKKRPGSAWQEAIAAALNAWPGMQHKPYWDFRTHEKHTELILPVPQKEKGGQ